MFFSTGWSWAGRWTSLALLRSVFVETADNTRSQTRQKFLKRDEERILDKYMKMEDSATPTSWLSKRQYELSIQPIYGRCALFLASSTSRTLFDRYLQQQHKGAQSPVLISKKEVRETVADVCVWILKTVLDFTTCFKTEFEWDNQSAAKKSSLAHFGTIRSKWAWGLNSRTYWNTLLLLLTLSLSLSLLLMIDHAGLGLVIPLGCLPRPPWLQPFCLRCASLWTLGRTGSGCVFDEKIRKQLTCNCKKNLAVNPAFFFWMSSYS